MADSTSPIRTSQDVVTSGEADLRPLAASKLAAGFVAPIIGRVALHDVDGYFGFPLIKKGETVTPTHVSRAQSLGRLYELIAATGEGNT
jgi:hypothetical protein